MGVNFILQEAHEKANEIRVKTEHDFNLEKQTLVHEAKLSIQDEFAKKEKDHEIQKRIVQCLIKIEENTVVIYCRKEDSATVKKVLPEAIREYVEIMKRESSVLLKPNVSLNTDNSAYLP